MNCAECRELLVAHVEESLGNPQEKQVVSHLKDRQMCRGELAEVTHLRDRLVASSEVLAENKLEDEVMGRIVREQGLRLNTPRKIKTKTSIWRVIMKSRMAQLTTVAAIMAVAVLVLIYFGESGSPLYALEDTVKANHSVRYIHFKSFKPGEDEPKEFWVEFDEEGKVKNMRMHMPEWESPQDGAKEIVWKEGVAEVWMPKKNVLAIIGDNRIADEIRGFLEMFDPKLVVERLHYASAKGEVEIETIEPSGTDEPIIVTATSLRKIQSFFRRSVLYIDQVTKLVTTIDMYVMKDDVYEQSGWIEYDDYNQPIEPETFVLDVPADAIRVDQVTQEIGLAQGDLSDKEIAVEVVRQFFEALIAKDYAKAGKLLEGVPADKMKEWYGKLNVVRIISIGEPIPHPVAKVGGFRVPCKVEIEKDGVKSIWEPYGPGVRPVINHPDRWDIHGGVSPP